MFQVELMDAGWVGPDGVRAVNDRSGAGTFTRERADLIAKAFYEEGYNPRLVPMTSSQEREGYLCEGGVQQCSYGADSSHWVDSRGMPADSEYEEVICCQCGSAVKVYSGTTLSAGCCPYCGY